MSLRVTVCPSVYVICQLDLHISVTGFCRKILFIIARLLNCINLCSCFNFYGSVHRNNILIYIQQDATLHILFYLKTALHVSGGTTTHYHERKQLYLQHLVFVTPLLLSAAIVEELEPTGLSVLWVAYVTHNTLKPFPTFPR
jgi:hypothetical protein